MEALGKSGSESRNSSAHTRANQIENRLWAIVNAIRERVSNARDEGLNSWMRAMRVKARGFRNKARFKTAIFFLYGQLDMRI
jgi:transposase